MQSKGEIKKLSVVVVVPYLLNIFACVWIFLCYFFFIRGTILLKFYEFYRSSNAQDRMILYSETFLPFLFRSFESILWRLSARIFETSDISFRKLFIYAEEITERIISTTRYTANVPAMFLTVFILCMYTFLFFIVVNIEVLDHFMQTVTLLVIYEIKFSVLLCIQAILNRNE